MTRTQLLGSAIFVLLTATRTGHADPVDAEDVVQVLPCRPTIACTAEIVRGGALEVETGYAQRRASAAPVNSVLALLKYSATDWLQLQLGTNNLVMSSGGSTQWMDGAYLGPKVVLVEQTARTPTVAVSALIMLPTRTGSEAITRTTDGYFWGYLSKDLLGFHADLNLGVDLLSITDQPATQVVAAVSVSHDLVYGLGAMLEGYAFEGGGEYAAHDAGVLMALSYAPTPAIMFDLGADIALHRDARNATVFVGVTFVPYHATHAQPRASGELAAASH